MNNHKEKSAVERIGGIVSSFVSDVAANPLAQLAVVVICALWFLLGLNTNVLTAVLSILAISLTQMVLNRQNEREAEAHRRDVAMHAKLDELVIATTKARNKMAGIEDELEEEEIAELKKEAKDAIEEAGSSFARSAERKAAKKALETSGGKRKTQEKPKTRQKTRAAPSPK